MSEPTMEREDGGPDEYICDDCSTIYPFDSLNPIQSFWERVSAGGEVPAGECPDEDCGALCYPVKIEPEVAPASCWYLVTLRVAFDDEDSCFAVQATDKADAILTATAQLREAAGLRTSDDASCAGHFHATSELCTECGKTADEHDEVAIEPEAEREVYINYVVRCGATEPIIEKGAQQ